MMEVPCTDCNFEDCQNKLMPQVAAARASSFIPSQDGLFAVQDVEAGTLVASFGPVKRVNRKDRPKLGYKIPIRETGTRRLLLKTACVCATSVATGDGTSLDSGPGYESECCQ